MLMRINYMGGKAKNQQRKTLTELTSINRNQAETAKQRIALSKLVDRVQRCALAETEEDEMSPTQLKAAELLISRILPVTKHETIEQTINNTYSISSQVSDKIASLLQQAKEKTVKGQVIESKADNIIDNAYQSGENDKQMLSNDEETEQNDSDIGQNGTYASQFLESVSSMSKQSLT
jgi:hypothetical protein